MNTVIHKQLDSRWSSKPYPTKNSSFGGNGCGCCACTHIAMEQSDKANWTPENLRPWMINQGFAYVNQGTTWQGITATLKHIGHSNVVCVWNDPMSEAWKELNKGNRMAILLMGAGWGGKTAGKKVYWTAGGHYITATDYYEKDGKHYFYIKDSGGRNNDSATNKMTSDGYYCYEDSMYGVVAKVWIVERLEKSEPKPYGGEFPNLTKSTTITNASKISDEAKRLAYAYGTSATTYSYKKGKPTTAFKTALNKVYPNRSGWSAPAKAGASCDVFVGTVVRSCGVDENFPRGNADVGKHIRNNTSKWTLVGKITKGSIAVQSGDIIRYATTKGSGHICIASEGVVREAAYNTSYGHTTKTLSARRNIKGKKWIEVYRAKGSSTTTTVGYLSKGDKGDEVVKLQKLLNWYGNYGLATDGIFGDGTRNAVKDFQSKNGLTADGAFGSASLAKAKEITK